MTWGSCTWMRMGENYTRSYHYAYILWILRIVLTRNLQDAHSWQHNLSDNKAEINWLMTVSREELTISDGMQHDWPLYIYR